MNHPMIADRSVEQKASGAARPWLRSLGEGSLFFFGIVLPLGALLFEAIAGMCAEMFFDPLPTVWHGLLVATVPVANFMAWRTLKRGSTRSHLWLGFALGFAIAVSVYYSILFLPMAPLAVMGLAAIIYFGLGLFALLPLSPLLAFGATLLYRRQVRQRLGGTGQLPGQWRGVIAALAVLTLASLPGVVTRLGLRLAVSPKPATSLTGIRMLRRLGNETILLRACYGHQTGPMDLVSWLLLSQSEMTFEGARAIYYRVTGDSFDTKPPPPMRIGRGRQWQAADEFDFDLDQGGDTVAGLLRGLALTDSRIDGVVYADAALAYLEWTLVFRNDYRMQREARTQLLLPPGAVVSRLTLWVDGEEREAAFAGRARVQDAYRRVVQRRQDPVLVTTSGPNRILLQCFPVPPNGGTMKTRLGITVPLALSSAETGRLSLPRMLERNFRVDEDRHHAVWIEGDGALSSTIEGLLQESTPDGGYALRGAIGMATFNAAGANVRVERGDHTLSAWALDRTADDGSYVLQRIVREPLAPPERVVFVLDGSRGMQPSLPAVAAAFDALHPDSEFAVVFAGDQVRMLAEPGPATPERVKVVANDLRRLTCVGGQDNTEALALGWDTAAARAGGIVVWVHGPARFLLSAGESLRQRFERRPSGPLLYAIQTDLGPQRLIEKLDGLPAVRQVFGSGDLQDDLEALLRSRQGDNAAWVARRERVVLPEVAPEGDGSTYHLVRLWAYDRVMELFASGQPENRVEAAELGSRYHLVTPLTGAVVLETRQQYDEAGLEPVPPGSVPTIPEPGVWAMLAIGLIVLALAHAHQRRASGTV